VGRYIEESFRKLDISGIEETSHEWKDNCDLEFEVVFDLTVGIIDLLLVEAALELRTFY
jgi:hypothetical protein